MNTDLQPSYYRDQSPESALKDTETTILHIKSVDPSYDLISPIITPRFAPSCSPTLLSSLGSLAKAENLPIQTHISENRPEISLVASLFPTAPHYAGVYDSHGLLTARTVLAHGVHLTPSERVLIKERGSSVSHCPVSNSSLSSGICHVRRLLDEGIKVGLGTDVSGGYSPSILTAAREAGIVSRILAGQVGWESRAQDDSGADGPSNKVNDDGDAVTTDHAQGTRAEDCERIKLSPEECLYLATAGGARCLGLEHKIGTFEVGKEFDAQVVEIEETSLGEVNEEFEDQAGIDAEEERLDKVSEDFRSPAQLWGKEDWSDRIAKWMFCGDDRNTTRVFVRGRCVWERKT